MDINKQEDIFNKLSKQLIDLLFKDNKEQLIINLNKELSNVLLKKGNDYANEDRLSNFKLSGELVQSSAKEACLTLIATKVGRLGSLIKCNKTPNNESISDSIKDLINYGYLLYMILEEEMNGR